MKWKLIFLIMIALVILNTPYIQLFFRAVNTMVHESGHAFAALLTQGKVYSISLFANTEGVISASSSTWWGFLITGVSGYFFASFASYQAAKWWSKGYTKGILFALLFLSLLNLTLWVRNPYGLIWLSIFSLFLCLLLNSKKRSFQSAMTLIIVVIFIVDSIRTSIVVFIITLAHPEQSGDAAILQQATSIPALCWGTIFLTQAIVFGFLAFKRIFVTKPHIYSSSTYSKSEPL